MGIRKLIRIFKSKPKTRPVRVGDVVVGWDDGLPNSINIDRSLLASALINRPLDFCNFLSLFGYEMIRADRGESLQTLTSYADKGLGVRYAACDGVTTGGSYLEVRSKRSWWSSPSENTGYWSEIAVGRSTEDHRLWKTISGSNTIIGTESVDITPEDATDVFLIAVGTTIKSKRTDSSLWNYTQAVADVGTPITVTDSDITSGYLRLKNTGSRYGSFGSGTAYWRNAWVIPHTAVIRDETSGSPAMLDAPEPIAYFEMPIEGSGKLPTDEIGEPRPVFVWDDEDIKAQADPYRIEMPKEVVKIEKPVPKPLQKKVEVLRRKDWSDEEIYALFPEAYPYQEVNRLAVTWSALIPLDSKGQLRSNIAVVRVFQSSPSYCHSIEKRIQAIKEMRGVRRLSREEAINLALKIDDKLHIHDLLPCRKHELGGKCFKEYRDWRIHTVGDKEEFADTKARKYYVLGFKGW